MLLNKYSKGPSINYDVSKLTPSFLNILKCLFDKGAFTYDVRFVDRKAGQAASDFTKKAYVVKNLIRVGTQVGKEIHTPKTSDVVCGCFLMLNQNSSDKPTLFLEMF